MVSATIQPTMPATVYIRWSSEAQTGRDSLRRQLEAAQRYAEEHRLLIVETIIDEAVSAFSGHHLTKGRLGLFIRRVEDRAVVLLRHSTNILGSASRPKAYGRANLNERDGEGFR